MKTKSFIGRLRPFISRAAAFIARSAFILLASPARDIPVLSVYLYAAL